MDSSASLNVLFKTDSLVKNNHFSVCFCFRVCVVLVLPVLQMLPVFSITEHLNKQVRNKKKVYPTKFLAASNQVQARRPAHRMLGRSVLNFREHHNLDTRRPNVRQPSPRPKSFKEYLLEGAPNYQPTRGTKLLTCPVRPPWSAMWYSLGLKHCGHFHRYTHVLPLFCTTIQIQTNQTYINTM
jgi:hypothetical protein